VTWNGTTYLYLTNIQGDVIAILDTDGNVVVQYTYDAWGNILTTTGTLAETLGTLNPLTYRAYVYDQETHLYYLQSRYYNPTIGRFINADAFTSTGQGLLGNNMFAYCANNPVVFLDDRGTSYRAVGAGLQFEISIGSSTVGIEVICYWDVDECSNGGVIIAAYAYCGFSFDMNDPLLGSIMATITDNSDLLANGNEAGILALASLIGDTFSISVSGVLVTGTERFTSTESYEGSFTSVDGSWGKLKASYAYSENCQAYSIGGKVTGASLFPSWSVSKTYYTQFYEFGIGQSSVNNVPSVGGGSILCAISASSRITFLAHW
jgi:RHS repeat-associated protein